MWFKHFTCFTVVFYFYFIFVVIIKEKMIVLSTKPPMEIHSYILILNRVAHFIEEDIDYY
jgi:hypothetical protein